jgi:hypothetical protein
MFMRFPGGKAKAVTFSYDDGAKSDVKLARILSQNGLKGTFNINSAWQTEWHSTDAEMKTELLDRGHEIAVHGRIHRAPSFARPIDTIRDVLDCREELEDRFGQIIRGYAYPDSGITRFISGVEYSTVKSQLEAMGIAYARSLAGDNGDFFVPNDPHNWIPTAHHNNPSLPSWIDNFLSLDIDSQYAGSRFPRLLYIWGHSSEFDRDNNWSLIEGIAEKLGKADDIWAATNIEFIEYLNAFRSLITSAKGDRVYNPTLKTIYFVADGKSFCIKPGEEILLEGLEY